MEKDLGELEEITFGIYSTEEIKNIAVSEIISSKLGSSSSDKNAGYGTVYDPRLGTIENGKLCETCNQDIWACPGHFGYINLWEPIVHPLFYKQVVSFLKCFCIKCFKLLITEDQINLNGFNKFKSVRRFNKILEKLEKIDICHNCSHLQPDIKYSSTDNTISMVYKQKDKGKVSIILPVDEIKKTFDNIDNKEVELLGFNTSLVHPRNLILTVFPVIPTACRPYIISEGNICDDDLTIQIVEIIKANNHLQPIDGVPVPETKRQKYLQSLKFRIATFYNNSCLAPETPVLMWDGSTKRADEIEWGDELVGDDGEKRIVQSVCSGEDDMYEIEQEKGEKYVVNSNHYITLKYTKHKKISWINPSKTYMNGSWILYWFDGSIQKSKYVQPTNNISKDEAFKIIKNFSNKIDDNNVFDIKIKDYLKLSKSSQKNLYGFKLNNYIKWDKKECLLDPYILGMWLGDGNKLGTGFTSADIELVNYWKKWANDNECEIVTYRKKLKKGDNNFNENEIRYRPDICFGIKSSYNKDNNKTHLNSFKEILRKYNLINNKHIPDVYLYNTKEIRLKILAGLLDTDGWKQKNNFMISQSDKHKDLLYQIQYLASSLGYHTSITQQKTKWKAKNQIRFGKKYILKISGLNLDEIPILLERKKCKNIKDPTYFSIKIKNIGKGKYNGFTVNKNHRFLLGDFTVTHNSGKADSLA
jgi:hypothetical protein